MDENHCPHEVINLVHEPCPLLVDLDGLPPDLSAEHC